VATNTSLNSSVTFQNIVFDNCFYFENKTTNDFIERGAGAIQILEADAQIKNCTFKSRIFVIRSFLMVQIVMESMEEQ
jgi:hypothetical protein